MKKFLLICIAPVYLLGWAGAMAAVDRNYYRDIGEGLAMQRSGSSWRVPR